MKDLENQENTNNFKELSKSLTDVIKDKKLIKIEMKNSTEMNIFFEGKRKLIIKYDKEHGLLVSCDIEIYNVNDE